MENSEFNVWKRKSHKEISELSIEVSHVLKEDPIRSPLYALMFAIDKGNTDLESIYSYFKYFYVNEFSFLTLEPRIIDRLIKKGINAELIETKENNYYLTEKGSRILEKARKVITTTNEAMYFFFSEKVVLIFSFFCLLFLSVLKIIMGLLDGSDALLNDGIENLTDIIKIVVILLSLKFNKDKVGALLIISLMLITGVNLMILSIISLFEAHVITPSYFAFVLMIVSMLINYILRFLKHLVGKINGNLSLLSDAKDNANNVKISFGVMIGLIFALFEIYFVDALVGILIAFLIIYDGVETLIALIKSGEDINIDSFKLRLDEAFEFRLADWILKIINQESVSEEQINERFKIAINKGNEIFGVWATFGLYDYEKLSIHSIIKLMKKRGIIDEKSNTLRLIGMRGMRQYNRSILRERKMIAIEREKFNNWKPPSRKTKLVWTFFGILFLIGLILITIFIGPLIYNWIVDFIT